MGDYFDKSWVIQTEIHTSDSGKIDQRGNESGCPRKYFPWKKEKMQGESNIFMIININFDVLFFSI